ncbi:MAG: hypothetical protein JXA37_07795 [Chloroflexia bacterium]|nr:hypothetical protein [Chloroflexia bacterium]
MPETLDLQKAERQAFNLSFQDGLIDLALGLELLALVLAPRLERAIPLDDWWIALLSLPILIALFVTNRLITTPRLGRVRFLAAHKARMRVVMNILGGLLLGVLLVGMAWFWLGQGPFPERVRQTWSSAVLWTALSLSIFGLSAYVLGLPRLYLYGVLYAGVYPARVLSRVRPEWGTPALVANLVSAAVLLATGSFLLIRFLRSDPAHAGEEFYGEK